MIDLTTGICAAAQVSYGVHLANRAAGHLEQSSSPFSIRRPLNKLNRWFEKDSSLEGRNVNCLDGYGGQGWRLSSALASGGVPGSTTEASSVSSWSTCMKSKDAWSLSTFKSLGWLSSSFSLKSPFSSSAPRYDFSFIDSYESGKGRSFMENATIIIIMTCLHLGGTVNAADALNLASAPEDRLLGVVRRLEAASDTTKTNMMEALRVTLAPALRADTASSRSLDDSEKSARNLVEEVYEVVAENFDDARSTGFELKAWKAEKEKVLNRPLRDANAAHSAIRDLLTKLNDPYSRYLTPEEFQTMSKYDVSGVGLNLGSLDDLKAKTGLEPYGFQPKQGDDLTDPSLIERDSTESKKGNKTNADKENIYRSDGVWIIGVIRGSIADQAGLRQGDRLLMVDGSSITGQTPFAVASLFQKGEKLEDHGNADKTTATIQIMHLDGTKEEIKMNRPLSTHISSPVSAKMQSGDVGYVKLSSFNARAVRDVESAIRTLINDGAESFVFDLRGNRGGLVSEGIEVARLFLDPGDIIVRPQGRARSGEPPVGLNQPLTKLPVTVLVNGRTASAAEIFAGAIQDNCRGVLVGESTYGKGLIQSVYELSDGSGLVLTVGKYLTPNGTDIDYKGITPNFGSFHFLNSEEVEKTLNACRIKNARF